MTPPHRDADRSSTDRDRRHRERPNRTDRASADEYDQLVDELADCVAEFEELMTSLESEDQPVGGETADPESPQPRDADEESRHSESPRPRDADEGSRYSESLRPRDADEGSRHSESPRPRDADEESRHSESPRPRDADEGSRYSESLRPRDADEESRHREAALPANVDEESRHRESPRSRDVDEKNRHRESHKPGDVEEGARSSEFVFPAAEPSEDETHHPTRQGDSDIPDDLGALQSLVEELRGEVSDILQERSAAQPTGERPGPRQTSPENRDSAATEPTLLASRGRDSVSLPDVVQVLTEVIEIVTAISEDLQDTKRTNGALWEVLNDIQVDIVELQRELARLETRQDEQGLDDEPPEQMAEQTDPFRQLAEQLNTLLEMAEADTDEPPADEQADEPAEESPADEAPADEGTPAEDLREEVEDIREELDEIREQVQENQPDQQVTDLRDEIEDVREAVAVVRDDLEDAKRDQGVGIGGSGDPETDREQFREAVTRLEEENEAIRELITGLHSRI